MAQNDDLKRVLRAGIEAARRGDRATGRNLLERVVREEPRNEAAWMWLASCMTTVRERQLCLQRVLQINPSNARAREALTKLSGEVPSRLAGTLPRPPQRPVQQERKGGFDILNLAIIVMAALAVFLVLLFISQFDELFGGPAPTPTLPAVLSEPSPTPRPSPTIRTPIPFTGGSGAPTLPPTFTPRPQPTATLTLTPSPTPYPLEEFVVLFTSLQPGDTVSSLYGMNGDGSGVELLGEDFLDMVFDPAGRRIAFIREVTESAPSSEDEAVVTPADTEPYPELFIAEVDNLDGATQITNMQTTNVSSPTWSPDGRSLVFVSDMDGSEDLWYITADGDELRNLTANDAVNLDPAWEPQPGSRRLLFASDINSVGSTEIYSMELPAPGEEPVYTRLTADNNSSYAPSWSWDGRSVVFLSDRTGDADVYTMNPDGSNQFLVTVDDNDAEDRSPSFTPDGRYIVFISKRLDDRFQSYLISPQGDVLIRLTDHEREDTSIMYRPIVELRLQ